MSTCMQWCTFVIVFKCSSFGMIPIELDNNFISYELFCVVFVSANLAMIHTELSYMTKACEIIEACEQSCIKQFEVLLALIWASLDMQWICQRSNVIIVLILTPFILGGKVIHKDHKGSVIC